MGRMTVRANIEADNDAKWRYLHRWCIFRVIPNSDRPEAASFRAVNVNTIRTAVRNEHNLTITVLDEKSGSGISDTVSFARR